MNMALLAKPIYWLCVCLIAAYFIVGMAAIVASTLLDCVFEWLCGWGRRYGFSGTERF